MELSYGKMLMSPLKRVRFIINLVFLSILKLHMVFSLWIANLYCAQDIFFGFSNLQTL